MTYRKIVFLVLLSLALSVEGAARDLSKLRYCVVDNTAQRRVLIRNCIAAGRCQNVMAKVRTSLDGTKVIVKWTLEDNPPEAIPQALQNVCIQVLNNSEAKTLMRTSEWSALE